MINPESAQNQSLITNPKTNAKGLLNIALSEYFDIFFQFKKNVELGAQFCRFHNTSATSILNIVLSEYRIKWVDSVVIKCVSD